MFSKDTKNALPKNFFDKNPLEELSAAQFIYFNIITLNLPDLNKQIEELLVPEMEKERRDRFMEEKEKISEISQADEVVQYMRKIKELQNREALINKALEMQEDVVPLVLKRLLKSGHDTFIESAAILLAHADDTYTEHLYHIFREIRNSYARSATSIVFGVKKKKEYTSLLLEQFERIKHEAPEKGYEQGPLLALHLLYNENFSHEVLKGRVREELCSNNS